MRTSGCAGLLIVLIMLATTASSLWVGYQMLQEPALTVISGSPDDALRGQQKIYQIAGLGSGRGKDRPRQVVLSEPELNGFLVRHLADASQIPIAAGGVRLMGDGVVEFKGQLPVRQVLGNVHLSAIADLLPVSWLERRIWLHAGARVSLEVGAGKGHRRHLRLDVERFALGRQPLPLLMLGAGFQSLFRWRVPDGVEAIVVEPGKVVVKTAS